MFFYHIIKVEEIKDATVFSIDNTVSNNLFKSHNLEFPIEFRWRTSTANRYSFWRVYTGIKFLYNFSNTFQYEDVNSSQISYSNVSAYNNLQYGLTFSAGYDAFNVNIFYGISPVFDNAYISGESIDTRILKFGLIFYIL